MLFTFLNAVSKHLTKIPVGSGLGALCGDIMEHVRDGALLEDPLGFISCSFSTSCVLMRCDHFVS